MRPPRQITQAEMDRLARAQHRRQILAAFAAGQVAIRQRDADSYDLTDAAGRPARLRFSPDGGMSLAHPDGRRSTRWWDAEGRLVRLVGPGPVEQRIHYDPDGSVRIERLAEGLEPALTRIGYDPDGLPAGLQRPDGSASRIDWDAPEGEVLTDAAGHRSQRLRDLLGRPLGHIDTRGHRTLHGERAIPGGTVLETRSPAGRHEEMEIDEAGGRVIWRLDGQEQARAEGESVGGYPARVDYADGHFAALEGAEGRLVAAETPEGRLELSWDDAGNLMAEDQGGLVVRYERDATGVLTALVLPDGGRIEYGHDAGGRLVTLRDWAGGVTRLDWHPSGALARIAHPDGSVTEHAADPLGRITATQTRAAGGVPFSGRYAYDSLDRLVAAEEDGVRLGYRYDGLGRLVAVEGPGRAERWPLDPAGNATEIGGVPHGADPDNRLTGPGIAHDARGRMVAVGTPAGPLRLGWNGQNRLVRAQLPGGRLAEYGHDALGRRLWKRVDGRVTRFLWAGPVMVSEWTDDPQAGFTRRDHMVLPDGWLPLAMRVDGRVLRVHCDRRGAPTTVTDGGALWQARLSAFGAARVAGSAGGAAVACPWRLPNQYCDPETGLHYTLARYAHPGLGRFLSPDPLFDPMTRGNWYLYAAGDPVNRTDPTGEVVPLLIGAAVVGGVMGGGITAWQSRNEDIPAGNRAVRITAGTLFGGAVALLGAAAGAVALAGLAKAGLVAGAKATLGKTLGVAALTGAAEGAVSSTVEVCLESLAEDHTLPSAKEVGIGAGVGAGAGVLTRGGGGAVAARRLRSRQRAQAAGPEGAGPPPSGTESATVADALSEDAESHATHFTARLARGTRKAMPDAGRQSVEQSTQEAARGGGSDEDSRGE